jgi:hypothetical protein
MVTGILLYLAFIRLLHSDYHIEGGAMLLTASIAVCANLLYVPIWSRCPVGFRMRGLFPDTHTHIHTHTGLHCLYHCEGAGRDLQISQQTFVKGLPYTGPLGGLHQYDLD